MPQDNDTDINDPHRPIIKSDEDGSVERALLFGTVLPIPPRRPALPPRRRRRQGGAGHCGLESDGLHLVCDGGPAGASTQKS
jgi:hypothetical protein